MSKAVVAKVRGTQRSIVVLGTSDAHAALVAADLSPARHRWGGTYFYDGGWVLHRDGTASQTGPSNGARGGRPAVMFGNIEARS